MITRLFLLLSLSLSNLTIFSMQESQKQLSAPTKFLQRFKILENRPGWFKRGLEKKCRCKIAQSRAIAALDQKKKLFGLLFLGIISGAHAQDIGQTISSVPDSNSYSHSYDKLAKYDHPPLISPYDLCKPFGGNNTYLCCSVTPNYGVNCCIIESAQGTPIACGYFDLTSTSFPYKNLKPTTLTKEYKRYAAQCDKELRERQAIAILPAKFLNDSLPLHEIEKLYRSVTQEPFIPKLIDNHPCREIDAQLAPHFLQQLQEYSRILAISTPRAFACKNNALKPKYSLLDFDFKISVDCCSASTVENLLNPRMCFYTFNFLRDVGPMTWIADTATILGYIKLYEHAQNHVLNQLSGVFNACAIENPGPTLQKTASAIQQEMFQKVSLTGNYKLAEADIYSILLTESPYFICKLRLDGTDLSQNQLSLPTANALKDFYTRNDKSLDANFAFIIVTNDKFKVLLEYLKEKLHQHIIDKKRLEEL